MRKLCDVRLDFDVFELKVAGFHVLHEAELRNGTKGASGKTNADITVKFADIDAFRLHIGKLNHVRFVVCVGYCMPNERGLTGEFTFAGHLCAPEIKQRIH